MAAKRQMTKNHSRLKQALARLARSQAALVQAEAKLVQSQALSNARLIEVDRVSAETFARLDALMAEILHKLAEQRCILERLPDAICEKIGFKTQPAKE